MKLEGKVMTITGAATGIGQAVARLFVKEGAKVVIADINDEKAGETIKLIKKAGGEAIFTHVDVTVVAELEKMIKTAVDTYGRLDIFYHNAGIAGPGYLELTSEEAYDQTMAIHLKAGFFGAKFAVPEMRRIGGGCILFTASGLGLRPSPQSPVYSVAKAGLVMLTRALAVALAKDNIRVNAICPGPVSATTVWDGFRTCNPGIDPDEYARMTLESRLIKRFGTPEEMAAAALYLASPEASYITGIALPVDGGGVAR